MADYKLQFLGGGKMAEALLGGLISDGWASPNELVVVERFPQRRQELQQRFDGLMVLDSPMAETATVVAVKPQDIQGALAALVGLNPGAVVSIAAGVTIASLEAALDPGTKVIRCMPNTPALVSRGASAVAGGATASDADVEWAKSILSAVGLVEEVTEAEIDAVTGLSGSGPAYVFLLAEELAKAGAAAGLDPDTATRLAYQTVAGAGELLAQSQDDAATLRKNVTSPGGTTAAGIAALQAGGFAELIDSAVQAATARSVELGQPDK